MKLSGGFLVRALAVFALTAVVAAGSGVFARSIQYSGKQDDKSKAPQVSDAENKALAKINAAVGADAKLTAADEFVKKHAKSAERPKVVQHIAGEITKVQDAAQQVALWERFLTVFTEPGDTDLIAPTLVEAYLKANRVDDMFRVGATAVQKNPNDVVMLTQLAIFGIEQAKQQNPKYVQQSMQYGAKAIELIEADKKPELMDATGWNQYKTYWLPQLYQSLGLVSLMTGNKAEAKARLDKAAAINDSDPFTFVLLGSMANDQYQELAEKHKTMNAGPVKDDTLKQAHERLDSVIEFYARAVALAEGKPAYQRLRDQIMQDLQTYYKYRHKGSTDGLQQLIDKYKKPGQ
jgi:tetratricopeptide (TPR) repeat protein